jgi:alpha-L-fucosidase
MSRDWFKGAGLGLFIHWGHYSQAGWDASWSLVGGVKTLPLVKNVPIADYYAATADWRPEPGWPARWAASAKAMGARYAVLGARHHDGVALWPSAAPGAFSIKDLGIERDIVREFVDACRAEGVIPGLYYSLSDWKHADYPAFTEDLKPYRFDRPPSPTKEQWGRYKLYLEAQLTELLTHYGDIACLWFDGGWERPAKVWGVDALEALIRRLQPNILINDRLPEKGDYATPEQFIPAAPPDGLWEACLTMNRSWGFNAEDHDYKSPTALIHALCETAGRGGNLLLNIGPEGSGAIPAPQQERLEIIGSWMARNGAAIYDTAPGLEPWQFYGPSTRKADTLYCLLTLKPNGPVAVRGLQMNRIKAVTHLATGQALAFEKRMAVMEELFSPDPIGELLIDLPNALVDPHATVIAIEMSA